MHLHLITPYSDLAGTTLVMTTSITTRSRVTEVSACQVSRTRICLYSEFLNPLSDLFSAPGGDSGWDLTAGVTKVLGQLRLSCAQEKQFRALNLDITCPAHLPLPTACRCVTRSKTGGAVTKVNGTISTYDVSESASSPLVIITDTVLQTTANVCDYKQFVSSE